MNILPTSVLAKACRQMAVNGWAWSIHVKTEVDGERILIKSYVSWWKHSAQKSVEEWKAELLSCINKEIDQL